MGKEIDVKTCLQTIDDLVTVEDKLVTYRSVSKVLKVHTDQAKELLRSYVNNARDKSKQDELAVVYLVGGPLKDAASVCTRFSLVPTDKLDSEKQRFSQVDTEHVYSVCRGRRVTVADIYNAAHSVAELDKQFSSIKCNDEDVQRRPRERVTPAPPAPPAHKVKTVQEEKPMNQNQNQKKGSEPSKPARKSPEKKKTSPKKKNVPSAPPKGGGINAMFKRQAEKKKEEEKSLPKPEKPTVKEDSPELKTPKDKQKTNKQKKKSSKGQNKKLRRIRVVSDSESDSASDEDDKDEEKEDELRRMDVDEPELEPEPTVRATPEKVAQVESDDEIILATPVEEKKKGRKRIRKQVDKSFLDDEGYLCVKKEYVFESCSDNDNDDGEKPAKSPKTDPVPEPTTSAAVKPSRKSKDKAETVEAKPKKGKKNVSPQKGKQASITSFFKKM